MRLVALLSTCALVTACRADDRDVRPIFAAKPAERSAEPPAERPAPRRPTDLPAVGARPALADVIDRVLPAVVSVASTRKVADAAGVLDDPVLRELFRQRFGELGPGDLPEQKALGSGVIVARDTILTSSHVVAGATALEVTTSDGHALTVDVAGTDPKSDLAVLRVRGDTSALHPIELGASSSLRLGDSVLAIGNPFGVGATVTEGIVSALGRANVGITEYEDFIQTDAAINPGNSGGALIDTQGRLIGIPTAIVSRSGGSAGIGFAIPIDMAKPIMQSLLATGKVTRSWLGVGVQQLDDRLARALGLTDPAGLVIADVSPDGPAARAGLERGDVIRKLDGTDVHSVGDLRNRVAAVGVGKHVTLELVRGGKSMTTDVTLAERPRDQNRAEPAPPTPPAARSSGIDGLEVVPLTRDLRRRIDAPASVTGVLVTDVDSGSAAAHAGLQPGDVIVEADHQPTPDAKGLSRALAQTAGPIALLVWRDGATIFVPLER